MLNRFALGQMLLRSVATNVFCDAHRAKVGAAHSAKIGTLRSFHGKGLIVKRTGGFGVEGEIELVFPAEFEARLTNSVVPVLGAGMAFGQVGGVRSDLVCDDAVFHILLIWQTEMFFR